MQLYRRIKVLITLTRNSLTMYEWKKDQETYEVFECGDNPIAKKYHNTDLSKSEKEELASIFITQNRMSDKKEKSKKCEGE